MSYLQCSKPGLELCHFCLDWGRPQRAVGAGHRQPLLHFDAHLLFSMACTRLCHLHE